MDVFKQLLERHRLRDKDLPQPLPKTHTRRRNTHSLEAIFALPTQVLNRLRTPRSASPHHPHPNHLPQPPPLRPSLGQTQTHLHPRRPSSPHLHSHTPFLPNSTARDTLSLLQKVIFKEEELAKDEEQVIELQASKLPILTRKDSAQPHDPKPHPIAKPPLAVNPRSHRHRKPAERKP